MEFAKISTIGQVYTVYSRKYDEDLPQPFSEPAVLLSPSLSADFAVSGIKNAKTTTADPYTSAICSAAYLNMKSGLPLSEITFETESGNVEIFNTGVGQYLITLNKCKHLSEKTMHVGGSDIEFSDVLCGSVCRIAFVNEDAVVRPELARILTLASDRIPSAVVFATAPNSCGEISRLRSYFEHSAAPPSRAAICAVAAYAAYICGTSRFSTVRFPSGVIADTSFSSVTLHVSAQVTE